MVNGDSGKNNAIISFLAVFILSQIDHGPLTHIKITYNMLIVNHDVISSCQMVDSIASTRLQLLFVLIVKCTLWSQNRCFHLVPNRSWSLDPHKDHIQHVDSQSWCHFIMPDGGFYCQYQASIIICSHSKIYIMKPESLFSSCPK